MKTAILIFVIAILITIGGFAAIRYKTNQNEQVQTQTFSPVVKNEDSHPVDVFSKYSVTTEEPKMLPEETNPLTGSDDLVTLVLLGIDRRSKDELGFRTDTIVIVSANTETNKVVLTSVPRDLWVNGGRINALFTQNGWESLQAGLKEITGFTINDYIYTDFDDFVWIVDAMGGVPVTVERTFVDTSYPVDETKEYQTIEFTAGAEKLTGERALIYARSRKGDNGEGSDWMRMRRQHLILKGMLDAVTSPESIFNPMVVEEAFKLVTTNKMITSLSLDKAKLLWDLYKDKDLYEIESLYLDGEYLYNPPLEDYGGAWVLVENENGYKKFQEVLNAKLNDLNYEDTPTSTGQEVIPQAKETPTEEN
ncbi:MAG: LCP family protein [Patescibacteria group bacterium]